MYIFLFFVFIFFFFTSPPSFGACTGNTLGACSSDKPQNCNLERVVVGSSLTSVQDVDKGRTSYPRVAVPFVHDGGILEMEQGGSLISSFTVSAILAGEDATDSVNETSCSGNVLVFFNVQGAKTIRLKAEDLAFEREATSSNALTIVYDNQAPNVTPLQVWTGPDDKGTPLSYSAGITYYTSNELYITAKVTDPEPAQSWEKLGMRVQGGLSQIGEFQAPIANLGGVFGFALGLNSEPKDGEFLVEVVAYDASGENFEDQSPANRSTPVIYRVVLDRQAPVMTKLEAIRNPGQTNQIVQELPGVFVKAEAFKIRATFSERLKTPPTLSIRHQGIGVGTPPGIYKVGYDTTQFSKNPSVVEYLVTLQSGLNSAGPVNLIFSENARDIAGNPLDLAKGVLKNGPEIENALILDVVAPDIKRLSPEESGMIQSVPANNSKLPKGSFPKKIMVVVKDYDIPDNLSQGSGGDIYSSANAVGVDFSSVLSSKDADSEVGLRMKLLGPDGNEIYGTLSTRPPNGLLYILPPEDELFGSLPGRVAPEGRYTIHVTLVDQLGNQSVETIFFEMDNSPIASESIKISLLPAASTGNFAPDTENPLLKSPLSGTLIPDNPNLIDLGTIDSVNTLRGFEVCSTDPTFSLTLSVINLKARLNGPDTVGRSLNLTGTAQMDSTESACGGKNRMLLQVGSQSDVFPDYDFPFPNPTAVGEYVQEGERDPRYGQFDGPYIVEVEAQDDAGNRSDPITREFLLDTTPPYTLDVFPKEYGKVTSPLRHVSAVVIDPAPSKLHVWDEDGHINFGSGISISYSGMALYLKTPYRPSQVSPELFDSLQNYRVRTRMDYTHKPNNLDPDLPTFNEKDDYYRLLIEFVSKNGQTTPLPSDGSADGIYELVVTPVDNTGNSIDGARAGNGGFRPPADLDKNAPQELKKNFYFLLDSRAPQISFQSLEGKTLNGALYVSGRNFSLAGTARDLSYREDPTKGGSGLDRVEYEVVLLKEDGSLVPVPEASEGGVVRKNPIVTGKASLSSIKNEASDPTVSQTRPMDPTAYPEIILEQREWRVDAVLPDYAELIRPSDAQGNANYFLKIKAYDQAGNLFEKSQSLILNQGALRPPDLKLPEMNQAFRTTAISFRFKKVENAADYILYISRPDGTLTTSTIPAGTENEITSLQILNQQGPYQWWVRGRDSVGNLGDEPMKQKFTVDTNAPVVSFLTWADQSPVSQGKLTRGRFRLTINFSENLLKGPEVTFQPFDISIPPQVVETYFLRENLWEGYATIPQDADQKWNGQAVLHIQNGTDLAGNKLMENHDNLFEIATGANFSLRFFMNPVFEKEITLVVRSTEMLQGNPEIFIKQGLNTLGGMTKISDYLWSQSFSMSDTIRTSAIIEISGKTLFGNVSTRELIVPLVKSSSTTLSLGKARFSFDSETPVFVFTQEKDVQLPQKTSLSLAKVSELEVLDEGILLWSGSEKEMRSTLKIHVTTDLSPKDGWYFRNPSETLYLGRTVQELKKAVRLQKSGELILARDHVVPVIENKESEVIVSRRLIRQISDAGSGILTESIEVFYRGKKLDSWEYMQGKMSVRLPQDGFSGTADFSIQVSDRAGNQNRSLSSLQIQGPPSLHAQVYPNPARSFLTLRYTLSQNVLFMQVKIRDSFGDRIVEFNSDSDPLLQKNQGTHEWKWDLFSENLGLVANGVYFVELEARFLDGQTLKKRLKSAVLR